MRIYNIYTKIGHLKLSTFNEDKAWENVDFEKGDTIDITNSED
jgi:hypothetical protein